MCLGVQSTAGLEALDVEAGFKSLELRKEELAIRQAAKIMSKKMFHVLINVGIPLQSQKLLNAKGSLTVWALYAYFSDSQSAAFKLLVWCM